VLRPPTTTSSLAAPSDGKGNASVVVPTDPSGRDRETKRGEEGSQQPGGAPTRTSPLAAPSDGKGNGSVVVPTDPSGRYRETKLGKKWSQQRGGSPSTIGTWADAQFVTIDPWIPWYSLPSPNTISPSCSNARRT